MSWLPRESVLVPVDFSDGAFRSLDVAREMLAPGGHLHVLHAMQSLHPIEPGLIWEAVSEDTRREQVKTALEERLGGTLSEQNIQLHLPFGDPGRQIAAIAEAQNIDLIIMPSHGRRGLERLLLGSVTERVLRLAHCPVLVMRFPD